RAHTRRPRRQRGNHRRPPGAGGIDARRRSVNRPLDPIEVAAATLASLPDMTHGRLRELVERGGGVMGALAALERGLAAAVLCNGATAEELPARQSLARVWQASASSDRTARALVARNTRVFVAGRPGYPIDEALPDRPEVLLAEGDDPGALDRPRV